MNESLKLWVMETLTSLAGDVRGHNDMPCGFFFALPIALSRHRILRHKLQLLIAKSLLDILGCLNYQRLFKALGKI
jgi:hypothetical protein